MANLLERSPATVLAVLSCAYFAMELYRAHRKLFWFDEIFTFYISRLPDLRSIWSACTHGVDFNPPLLYLLTRWSQGIVGVNELGTRLPEIIGFWIFCICLYRFVAARTNPLAGYVAFVYPLTTSALWYATDARSHGLVLGFAGLAWVCWQSVAKSETRNRFAIAGCCGALTTAALCHCYAFLLFFPLGVAELTRSMTRRKVDAAMWTALAVPAMVSVLTVLPLLHATRSTIAALYPITFDNFLSGWGMAQRTPITFTVALAIAFTAVFGKNIVPKQRVFAKHEMALIITALGTPIFALFSAVAGHAPLYGRYSLIASGGFACLLAMLSAMSRSFGVFALAMCLLFVGSDITRFVVGRSMQEPVTGLEVPTVPAAALPLISRAERTNTPFVLLDSLEFAPLFHYASAQARSHMVFLLPDGNGDGYARLQNCCSAPGTLARTDEFLLAHRQFRGYGIEKLMPLEAGGLVRRGEKITVKECEERHCLAEFEAQVPRPPLNEDGNRPR